MSTPSNKNKGLDPKLFIGIGAIALLAGGVFLFRLLTREKCTHPVEFSIVADDYLTNRPIKFNDLTPGSEEWTWNFGDGSENAHVKNVEHIFKTAGKFEVTLTVNGECRAKQEVVIEADMLPEISPDLLTAKILAPAEAFKGEEVQFLDQTTGGAKSWAWNFGESATVDTRQNPTYTFKFVGKHKVTLVVNGSSQPAEHTIIIKRKPGENSASAGGGGAKLYTEQQFMADLVKVQSGQLDPGKVIDKLGEDLTLKVERPDGSSTSCAVFLNQLMNLDELNFSAARFDRDPATKAITKIKLIK